MMLERALPEQGLLILAIFITSALANFALNINPFKMPEFPRAVTCFASAGKVAAALVLATGMERTGHPFLASILGNFALGLATGQAFCIYTPFESRSTFASWYVGKLDEFADGTIASIIAAAATALLGIVLHLDGLDAYVTITLAAVFLSGKLAVASWQLRQRGMLAFHNGVKRIGKRAILAVLALGCLGPLFASLLPSFSYKTTLGEDVIAFFIGAALAFL